MRVDPGAMTRADGTGDTLRRKGFGRVSAGQDARESGRIGAGRTGAGNTRSPALTLSGTTTEGGLAVHRTHAPSEIASPHAGTLTGGA